MKHRFWKRPASRGALYVILVLVITPCVILSIPSLTDHLNTPDTIEWEQDGVEDGSVCHNHRTDRTFGGNNVKRVPYTAYAVWDNRNNRHDSSNPFDNGHGYIAVNEEPKYYFVNSANWPADARARVIDAFTSWSSVVTDKPKLVTRAVFKSTADSTQANIKLFWLNIDDGFGGGATFPFNAIPYIKFDSSYDWSYVVNPGNVPANKWHFLSVALHEIGHLIALDHTPDGTDDLMAPLVGEPPGTPGRRCFVGIDADAIEGVRDLYSIPVRPPVLLRNADAILIDQGQMKAYIPFSICNSDPELPIAVGYHIWSKGYVGPALDITDTVTVQPGTCSDVYGIVNAGSAVPCTYDSLTIAIWLMGWYDTCVQVVHVVEPQDVPLSTVPVVTILVLALILSGAIFIRRRAIIGASLGL